MTDAVQVPPPLAGITVVEFATMVAVPAATHLLATHGASVIKVEDAGPGDNLRRYGSQKNGMSGWFANVNAGKRSIGLDLTDPEALNVLWSLIEQADVFVEGFRSGVVERLGITWDEAHRRNPRLVWASSSGFGPSGPYADRPAFDPVIQSLAGWAGAQSSTGAPDLIRGFVADKVAAMTTAQAITSALVGRSVTGAGRKLELSMLESNVAFVWPDVMMHATVLDEDATHLPNLLGAYRLYECTDGWVCFTVGTDGQFQGLCTALDREDLLDDERFNTTQARAANMKLWFDTMGELVVAFTVEDTLERLVAADVPAMPVLDPTEVVDDPQIVANASIVEVEHPVVGRMRTPVQSARFADVAGLLPAPTHGQHTDEILTEVGVNAAAIDAMRERGACR